MGKYRDESGANKQSAHDACYSEMLQLLERHYERTGDLALKDVVDRAKKNSASR